MTGRTERELMSASRPKWRRSFWFFALFLGFGMAVVNAWRHSAGGGVGGWAVRIGSEALWSIPSACLVAWLMTLRGEHASERVHVRRPNDR